MTDQDSTAACGIYCPDCILLRNKFSTLAKNLREELELVEFQRYVSVKSPFGQKYKNYSDLNDWLLKLENVNCSTVCRVGGGCSGKPCVIMECCSVKNYEGCWECSALDECERFLFLEPRCGQSPKQNCVLIRKYGLECWSQHRVGLYKWSKR